MCSDWTAFLTPLIVEMIFYLYSCWPRMARGDRVVGFKASFFLRPFLCEMKDEKKELWCFFLNLCWKLFFLNHSRKWMRENARTLRCFFLILAFKLSSCFRLSIIKEVEWEMGEKGESRAQYRKRHYGVRFRLFLGRFFFVMSTWRVLALSMRCSSSLTAILNRCVVNEHQ